MKTIWTLLILATLCMVSCSSKNEYKITGNIDGIPEGKIILIRLAPDKSPQQQFQAIDTAKIKNGKFEFEGTVDLPELYFLALDEQRLVAQFFLENSNISIHANIDDLENTKIKGSDTNDEYSIFDQEVKKVSKDINSYKSQGQEAMTSGDVEKMKQANINIQTLISNMNIFSKNFIKEHSKSNVGPFIALAALTKELTSIEIDSMVNSWNDEIKSGVYAKQLINVANLKKNKEVGAYVPIFTLPSPEGNEISLSDFKGKYVLIDFWASWCGPCRREMPNVVKAYAKFKNKNFEILGVSLDNKKEDWVNAIEEDGITWPQCSDLKGWRSSVVPQFKITGIPHTILIDPEGKLIATDLRGTALDEKLSEIFK